MSTISSRPRVKSVSSTAITTVATGAVVVTARLLSEMLRQEGASRLASRLPVEQAAPIVPIRPAAAIRAARARIQPPLSSSAVTPVEFIKHEALLSLVAAPVVLPPKRLRESVTRLVNAASVTQARHAASELLRTATVEHQITVMKSTALACERASIDVGFTAIQSEVGISGELRIIAADPAGRVLVSEVSQDLDGELSLESEMVGVTDGTCQEVMDRFDEAVEQHGIRSDRPTRKFTGGVCELAFAREFLKRAPQTSRPKAGSASATGARQRRQQRLNVPTPRMQR